MQKKMDLKEYIDNAVKEVLREKLNESKKVKRVKKTVITENIRAIQKNFQMLREYIEYENEDEYNGDAMLDDEMSNIDANIPEIDKFIENIKSEALDAMTQLSRNGESNSDTFETLKKVFDVCHNTQKKKENKNNAVE